MSSLATATPAPAWMIGLVMLAGCTLSPTYRRPESPVAPLYPGAPAAAAAAATDIGWQQFFADERLRQLIKLALANNRDLRVAVLNVEQSQAQSRIIRAAAVPSVEGTAGYSRSHAAGISVDQWSASVGTSAYEVDLFGRVRSLNQQALETYFATAEAQRGARISLVANVADAYFTLRLAEAQLHLAQQTLATVQESFTLNQATFNAGASNELDLRTADGQVQTAKINVLTYQRQIALTRNALEPLIGRPLPGDLPAGRAFTDSGLLADTPAGLPSELVTRRPDILEAEHTLKAANANIGAARAACFPSLSLTGSAGTGSSQLAKLFGSGTGVWSFSPQVNVPIFTGGRTRAAVDAADVSRRIAVASYEKAIQTAFREVADALVAGSSYSNEIEAQAALIQAQQRRFEVATTRYRQGEDTYLSVLSAQQDLYSAQQSRLQTKRNKLASQIALYKALGGGWK